MARTKKMEVDKPPKRTKKRAASPESSDDEEEEEDFETRPFAKRKGPGTLSNDAVYMIAEVLAVGGLTVGVAGGTYAAYQARKEGATFRESVGEMWSGLAEWFTPAQRKQVESLATALGDTPLAKWMRGDPDAMQIERRDAEQRFFEIGGQLEGLNVFQRATNERLDQLREDAHQAVLRLNRLSAARDSSAAETKKELDRVKELTADRVMILQKEYKDLTADLERRAAVALAAHGSMTAAEYQAARAEYVKSVKEMIAQNKAAALEYKNTVETLTQQITQANHQLAVMERSEAVSTQQSEEKYQGLRAKISDLAKTLNTVVAGRFDERITFLGEQIGTARTEIGRAIDGQATKLRALESTFGEFQTSLANDRTKGLEREATLREQFETHQGEFRRFAGTTADNGPTLQDTLTAERALVNARFENLTQANAALIEGVRDDFAERMKQQKLFSEQQYQRLVDATNETRRAENETRESLMVNLEAANQIIADLNAQAEKLKLKIAEAKEDSDAARALVEQVKVDQVAQLAKLGGIRKYLKAELRKTADSLRDDLTGLAQKHQAAIQETWDLAALAGRTAETAAARPSIVFHQNVLQQNAFLLGKDGAPLGSAGRTTYGAVQTSTAASGPVLAIEGKPGLPAIEGKPGLPALPAPRVDKAKQTQPRTRQSRNLQAFNESQARRLRANVNVHRRQFERSRGHAAVRGAEGLQALPSAGLLNALDLS